MSNSIRVRAPDAWWVLLLATAVMFSAALAVAAPTGQSNAIDTIIVKYRATMIVPDADVLPQATLETVAHSLRSGFAQAGRTRDGAYRITLNPPLDIDEARAALNRLRMDPSVLYANFAPSANAGAVSFEKAGSAGLPTNRIIVKYRDPAWTGATLSGLPLAASEVARLTALTSQPLAWLRGSFDGANVLTLFQRLPVAQVEAIAALIAQQPDIEYAQADYIKTHQLVPTDPCYASAGAPACSGGFQWDLFDPVGGINMPAAWAITTGSASVKIAVVDTGVLMNHPDLAGRSVGGYDMILDCFVANDASSTCVFSGGQPSMNSRDSDASDPGDWITSADSAGTTFNGWFQGCPVDNSSFHGSHVSGTIGADANNGQGVAGINWVSQIVPVRVLGKCGGYTSDIDDGMVWAAGGSVPGVPSNVNPVRVLNFSLGGSGACSAAEQTAVNTALGLGAVVVVAAGNSNADASGFSPASCNGVITVAATTKTGSRASYSNFGTTVEIAAPGGDAVAGGFNILSTINNGPTSPNPSGYIYAQYAGTSMATPHVTGVVSLILSANPSLTPSQVLAAIQSTARAFPTGTGRDCTTALCGAGILDAGAAVASVSSGTGSVALGSSANPSMVGVSVTFTATVNGTAPTGTVAFKDNGVTIAGCAAVALTGGGNSPTAQCSTSALTAGTHPIVASYSGDGSNAAASSSTLSQVVNSGGSGLVLTSSLNPSNVGQSVTFTATIAGTSVTGTVAFTDNASTISGCGSVAVSGGGKGGSGGTAQCTTSALTAGSHTILASYTGNQPPASGSITQTVNGGGLPPTTTVVTSSVNPSTVGQSVTFTATVTGTAAPTGNVAFTDNSVSIAGCTAVALTGAGNVKTAQCTTSALTAGVHTIAGSYGGDAGNAGSNGNVSQTVNSGSSALVLTSSLNPSNAGQSVTFTATISGSNVTGTVAFTDNASTISGCGSVAVTSGGGKSGGGAATAQCTTSALTAGSHTIMASYGGNGSNPPSSGSLTQTVNGGGLPPTTTVVTSSVNPSTVGQSVTFTATVTGTAAPTGNVAFTDNSVSIAGCTAVALTGAGNVKTAQCTTSALTAGVHTIAGSYGGDAGNAGSNGNVSQTVNSGGPPPTTTTLVSSLNPSTVGASVTFTATVSGNAPTGTVAFTDNTVTIPGCGAVALVTVGKGKSASCTTSGLTAGTHTILATYSGDANNASSSKSISQVVN